MDNIPPVSAAAAFEVWTRFHFRFPSVSVSLESNLIAMNYTSRDLFARKLNKHLELIKLRSGNKIRMNIFEKTVKLLFTEYIRTLSFQFVLA